MRKYKQMLVPAVAVVAVLVAASALYAEDSRETSGSVKRGGMMGRGDTTGRTSRMMSGCGAMMQGGRDGRPNDQWRKEPPATPDKDS